MLYGGLSMEAADGNKTCLMAYIYICKDHRRASSALTASSKVMSLRKGLWCIQRQDTTMYFSILSVNWLLF